MLKLKLNLKMSERDENEVTEAPEVVDEAHFRNGLYCIGKTFNNARHAYLSLKLSSLELLTINVSQRS